MSETCSSIGYIVGKYHRRITIVHRYGISKNVGYVIEQIVKFYIFESRINVENFLRYQPVTVAIWTLFCVIDTVRAPGWSGWSGDSEGPVVPASPPRPCGHAGLVMGSSLLSHLLELCRSWMLFFKITTVPIVVSFLFYNRSSMITQQTQLTKTTTTGLVLILWRRIS